MKMAQGCDLYAIAGRDADKVERFKNEYGFEKGYVGYENLLADEEVQAVYIPLPNGLHYEWVIKALKAGKHVLCEKPLAPSETVAKQMIDAANANGVILMEAFAYLHSPFVAAVKNEIASGAIGDVLYMESAFITSDYDLSNIRMRRDALGGCLYDLGCYNTSQILWMLEEEPMKVQAVSDFSEDNIDVYTTALLTYENGKRAVLNCGMCLKTEGDQRIDRFQIHGTKGYLRSEARFNQAGQLSYTICVDGKEETKVVDVPQNYRLEVEQLGRCILEGEMPHVSHEFTLKNARLIDRILAKIGY
jgi:predicted dehydrogenase